MKIKAVFEKNITRPLKRVVTMGGNEKCQEFEEYVFTKETIRYLKEFLSIYIQSIDGATNEIGVWVSGFFGSGKSHFMWILSQLLEEKRTVSFLRESGKITDEELLSDMEKAVSVPTDVIAFNIASRSELSNRENITMILLKVFNEMQGFSSNAFVADMERMLCEKGLYDRFKVNFEKIAGSPWEEARNRFDYIQDEIVKTLADIGAMSELSARNLCNRFNGNYPIDTESFARLVRQYLDSKGEKSHVVFLVDEMGQYLGENQDLILNLQTITEDLGRICQGRAWVIVTSQQELHSQNEDFSKIQGRFATKLHLSSANVDEVITERILSKNQMGHDALCGLYDEKEISLRNLLFGDVPYQGREHFSAVYPFVPYQFELISEILKTLRTSHLVGKHLADGERSMLALFQECAVQVKEMETGAVVPLHLFYDAISEMLDDSVKIHLEGMDGFSVSVLKTLFLVRYSQKISSTPETITSLMISHVNQNRMELKNHVEKALKRLVRKCLVLENNGQYTFLNHEEQQIEHSISAIPIDTNECTMTIAETIFGEIYTEKIFYLPKYGKQYAFPFQRMVDGQLYHSSPHTALKVHILTPDSSETVHDSKMMALLSGQSDVVLIVLPPNHAFIDELIKAKQIQKYLSSNINGNLIQNEQIQASKALEIRNRTRNFRIYLEDALKSAVIYVKGEVVKCNQKEIRSRINEGLKKLINLLYHKLSYMQSPAKKRDVISLLNAETIPENPNPYAVEDVKVFLTRNPMKIPFQRLFDKFHSAPYGFTLTDVQWLVAYLFRMGNIIIFDGADIIHSAEQVAEYFNQKKAPETLLIQWKVNVSPLQLKAVKSLMRELFHLAPANDTPEMIMHDFQHSANELQSRLQTIQQYYTAQPLYPDYSVVEKGIRLLQEIALYSIPHEFFEAVRNRQEMLLDFAEDFEAVQKFFSGEQRTIFDEALQIWECYNQNKNYVIYQEFTSLVTEISSIIFSPSPYQKIHKLPALCQKFRLMHGELMQSQKESFQIQINSTKERIFSQLKEQPFEQTLFDDFTERFQELQQRVNDCDNMARFQSLRMETDALKIFCLNEISQKQQQPFQQKFISIHVVSDSPSWQIATKEDVSHYLAELEKNLLATLEENTITHIEF